MKKNYLKALMIISLLAVQEFPSAAQSYNWAIALEKGDTAPSATVECRASAIDPSGNMYLAGRLTGAIDFDHTSNQVIRSTSGMDADAYLAKYDAGENLLWVISVGGNGNNYINCIATDTSGNVYVAGGTSSPDDTSDFDPGPGVAHLYSSDHGVDGVAFIAKYDGNGNYLWVKGIRHVSDTLPGPGIVNMSISDIVSDEQSNIYITGGMTTAGVDFDPGQGQTILTGNAAYFVSYDRDGNLRWAEQVENDNHISGGHVTYIEGGVYFTGSFNGGTVDFDPGPGVELLGQNVNFGGSTYMVKYDAMGSYQWGKSINNTNASNLLSNPTIVTDRGSFGDIVVDESRNIYVVGQVAGSMDFNPGAGIDSLTTPGPRFPDIMFAKYDSTGNYLWAHRLNTLGYQTTRMPNGGGAVVVAEGYIYIAGVFHDSVDFDPSPGQAKLVCNGHNPVTKVGDIFVAKYDTSGRYICAQSFGGIGSDSPSGLHVSRDKKIYVAGNFQDTVDFNPGIGVAKLTNPFNYGWATHNTFLLKLGCQEAQKDLDTTICAGGRYVLGDSIYTSTGTYTYVVREGSNICGCDSTIVLDLTVLPALDPIITVDNSVLGVTNVFATYQWIKDGVKISGATQNTYTVLENGFYQVAVTNAEGCTDTSDVYEVNNVGVFDAEYPLVRPVRIFPNPASNRLYIEAPSSLRLQICIRGVEGSIYTDLADVRELNLSGLASGLYIIQVSDEDGRLLKQQKVVKQ